MLGALEKEGLKPTDIDTVIYTHLHNDHAGGALLFPEARTIFQRDEYANLLNQIPTQMIRSDFDKRTPGDLPHMITSLFPKMDKMELLGGEMIDITPAPDNMMPYLFNSVIYNHFAAYDSFNKLKLLPETFEPKWYLTGHDSWVINKHSFG